MFWRVAGLATASPVDGILDREHYTLEELLDEDDLIQECKSLNNRLITFLRGKEQVTKMMQYIVEQPPEAADDKRNFKFPFISCEVFTCEIDQIMHTVVEEPEILDLLFSFPQPDRPHSNLLSGYFSKVVNSLLLRKTPEIMAYLQAHREILKQLVDLIGTTSVMEVVMRLVGANDEILMYHLEKLEWLADTPLLDMLVEQLGPQKPSDVQANAAEVLSAIARTTPTALALKLATPPYVHKLFQHVLEEPQSMTSVINSLSVCITLLGPRRPGAGSQQGFRGGQQAFQGAGQGQQGQEEGQEQEAIVETIKGMLEQLGPILELLDTSKDDKVLPTTYGQLHPPLGIHRLKIVEFIGVLLASRSEHAFTDLIRLGGIKTCIDLLFRYHFNNSLHHQVERMVMSILESGNQAVLEHLTGDCGLLNRILAAYEEPNAPDTRPNKGAEELMRAPARSGYMGHLTRIANRIVQLCNASPVLDALVSKNEAWVEWQGTGLKRRNALENIYQWSCGRPASLDDRPGDGDEDDFNRQDRDYDLGSMSLSGGSVRSYGQSQFGQTETSNAEASESSTETFDVSLSSTEQGMTELRIDDSSASAEVEGAEGASAAAEGEGASATGEAEAEAEDESTAAAAAGMVSLMDAPVPTEASTAMELSESLFTSSESGQAAWVAFQEQGEPKGAEEGPEAGAGAEAEGGAAGAGAGAEPEAGAGAGVGPKEGEDLPPLLNLDGVLPPAALITEHTPSPRPPLTDEPAPWDPFVLNTSAPTSSAPAEPSAAPAPAPAAGGESEAEGEGAAAGPAGGSAEGTEGVAAPAAGTAAAQAEGVEPPVVDLFADAPPEFRVYPPLLAAQEGAAAGAPEGAANATPEPAGVPEAAAASTSTSEAAPESASVGKEEEPSLSDAAPGTAEGAGSAVEESVSVGGAVVEEEKEKEGPGVADSDALGAPAGETTNASTSSLTSVSAEAGTPAAAASAPEG